jgi:hypothetical protein
MMTTIPKQPQATTKRSASVLRLAVRPGTFALTITRDRLQAERLKSEFFADTPDVSKLHPAVPSPSLPARISPRRFFKLVLPAACL